MIDVKIKCDSCKFVDGCVDYGWSECKKFTQKPSEPITNEEYIKSCNTEQLAELINNIVDDGIIKAWMIKNNCCGDYLESVKWWLKQPHNNILKP